LYAHRVGQWAKKIRGRTHYFGPWEDPDGALRKYLEQRDDLHAGRTPRPDPTALTVKDLANLFLNAKQVLVDAGELSPKTWLDYKLITDELVSHAGKHRLVSDLRPDDFASLRTKLAKKWGPHRIVKAVQYTRSVFKYAYEGDLIDRPVRFGPGFARPSAKTMRLHKAKQGAKLFTRDEIHQLLEAAGPAMRAMILLGVNCGYGNTDCGTLPLSAIDWENAIIDFPRPKTGIPRRCTLWPETVAALKEALAVRPEPKRAEDADLVFITKHGWAWSKEDNAGPLTQLMRRLLNKLSINGHRNFYTLRHTFRTIADAATDQPAADYVMGHEVPHMSSHYRETISDERLRAVADHVRAWLFAQTQPAPSNPAGIFAEGE
jgi:integrase